MKSSGVILMILMTVVLGYFAYRSSFAFFTDSAVLSSNTFTAAAEFPTPTTSITPTPIGIADHLVISEVELQGANAGDEFIELYNPTGSSINLSTLPLKLHLVNSASTDENKNLTFINSTIPAHGFFLIGPSSGYTGAAPLDATYSTSGNSVVPNGSVYISSSTTAAIGIIDLIGLGNASGGDVEGNPIDNPTSNNSVERKAYSTSDATLMTTGDDTNKGNGYDTNNNLNDFITRTASQPQNSSSPAETP